MESCDPPEYLEELKKFLTPVRNTVFWGPCWHAHTEIGHFKPLVDLVRTFIPIEEKRILDSGCGSAGLLLAFKHAGAADLVGIEVDSNVYRLALVRTRALDHVRIFQEHAGLLKTDEESFDIVVSNHVIEHVLDYNAYLATLIRLVKPGGILFIACPNRLWPLEAHSKLPLIHFLPRRVARVIAKCIEGTSLLPRSLRDRGRTARLYERDLSYFTLKRILMRRHLSILQMNPPDSFVDDLLSHPVGNHILRIVQSLPYRWQRYASALFSRELKVICRKPGPGNNS